MTCVLTRGAGRSASEWVEVPVPATARQPAVGPRDRVPGARSGGGKGPYFEGGQLPLVRRLPFKRGFTNIRKIYYRAVNLDQLTSRFAPGAEVTPESLAAIGLLKKPTDPVVILGRGEIDCALTVKADRFSESAKAKIEDAGGSTETLER